MSKIEALTVYSFLLLIFINQVLSLRCWQCHSRTEDHGDFCGSEFDKTKIPTGLQVLKECNASKPQGTDHRNMRPVCRKDVKENENGERSYVRYCHFAHEEEPLNKCDSEDTQTNGKRITCIDCTTDGCNIGTGLIPIVSVILGPMLIAKLLTL